LGPFPFDAVVGLIVAVEGHGNAVTADTGESVQPVVAIVPGHRLNGIFRGVDELDPISAVIRLHYMLQGTAPPPDWEVFLYHRYLRTFSALWKQAAE